MSDIAPLPPQSHRGFPAAIVIAIILLAAAFVRFHGIDLDSLWADEFMSMQYSNGYGGKSDTLPRDRIFSPVIAPTHLQYARAITAIVPAMQLDTHPPLYAILLRLWRTMLGEDALAAPSLSAIWSILAVALLFATVRETSGTTAAGWSAAFLAVAASQVEFAHEVRSYALLLALVLACCWLVVRIEKRGATTARCVALSILLIASMLTHYYAAPPLAGLAIYAILRTKNVVRRKILITFIAAGAIWCLVWGPFFWSQRENFVTNMQWTREDPDGHVARSVTRTATLPARLLIPSRDIPWPITILTALAFIFPLAVSRWRRDLLLWWLILIFSVAMVLSADLIRSSHLLDLLRYNTVASAALCAIAAVILLGPRHGRWWNHLAPAALLLAIVLTLPGAYEKVRPDFRAMGAYLDVDMNKQDVLVIVEPTDAAWMSDVLYLAATHYLQHVPGHAIVLTKPADDMLIRELKSARQLRVINARRGTNATDFLPGGKSLDAKFFPNFAVVERVIIP